MWMNNLEPEEVYADFLNFDGSGMKPYGEELHTSMVGKFRKSEPFGQGY